MQGKPESTPRRIRAMLRLTMTEVTCPSCFELFSVAVPAPGERPTSLDYDCEICCRPMVLWVDEDGGVEARGLDDGWSA